MTRTDALLALVLAILVGALVFATRTDQQTGDSLWYAFDVREGGNLIHPHHLAYLPVLRMLYVTTAGNSADPSAAVITTAQIHGAFWASIGVAAAFLAFRRIGFSRTAAVTGAGSLLVAQGFWVLATQVSPYVPSIACLAVAFAVGIGGDTDPPSARRLAVAAVPWAAAVLFHQVNVLYALPLLAGLFVATPRRAPRLAMAATFPAAVVVLSAYVTAFLVAPPSPSGGGLVHFVLRYAYAGKPQWGTLENVQLPGVLLLFRNQLWNLLAVPTVLLNPAAFVFAAVSLLLVGWHATRIARGAGDRALRVFLLTWLASYSILILWWVPSEKKLYSLTILPVLLLVALAGRDLVRSAVITTRGRRAILGVAAGIVSIVGLQLLVAIILPLHTTPRPAFVEAQRLARASAEDCTPLLEYEVTQTLRYYFGWRWAASAAAPLIQAYHEGSLDAVLEVRECTCVIADLDYVRPDRKIFGFDGYREPLRWTRYLDWLFGLERDRAGQVVSGREFDVFTTGPERAYVRIGPARLPVDGLEGLCARLDALSRERAGRSDDVFSAWLDRTRKALRVGTTGRGSGPNAARVGRGGGI